MKNKRYLYQIIYWIILIGLTSTSYADAVDGPGLVQDKRLKTGALANGFRYYIMANEEPPDRVNMRRYVDAGSLMETGSERGIAHFLEHLRASIRSWIPVYFSSLTPWM